MVRIIELFYLSSGTNTIRRINLGFVPVAISRMQATHSGTWESPQYRCRICMQSPQYRCQICMQGPLLFLFERTHNYSVVFTSRHVNTHMHMCAHTYTHIHADTQVCRGCFLSSELARRNSSARMHTFYTRPAGARGGRSL